MKKQDFTRKRRATLTGPPAREFIPPPWAMHGESRLDRQPLSGCPHVKNAAGNGCGQPEKPQKTAIAPEEMVIYLKAGIENTLKR